MTWWQTLGNRLGLHRCGSTDNSADAVQAAEQSHAQAVRDREQAALTLAEAERLEAQIHRHNTANRFDVWLARIQQGEF